MKRHFSIDLNQYQGIIVSRSTTKKATIYLIIGIVLIATLYFQFNTETVLGSLETELDNKQTWYWIAFIGLCVTGYAGLLFYKGEEYFDAQYGEKLTYSDFYFESDYKKEILTAIANNDESIIDIPRYKFIDEGGQEIIVSIQNTLKNNSDIVFAKIMQGNTTLLDWNLIQKNNRNQGFFEAIKNMVEKLHSD